MRFAFNDRSNPDDDLLGIQIVKVHIQKNLCQNCCLEVDSVFEIFNGIKGSQSDEMSNVAAGCLLSVVRQRYVDNGNVDMCFCLCGAA